MKWFFSIMTALVAFVMHPAHAEFRPTWVCTGEDIILEERSPYLGEESVDFMQFLFVLKRKSDNQNETKDTAFFLDVREGVGKFGIYYIEGENEVGGFFSLQGDMPVDKSEDSVTPRQEMRGVLTYSHGPLQGEDIDVFCVRE